MPKLDKAALEKMLSARPSGGDWIKVGMSTCGLAAGAQEVYDTLLSEAKRLKMAVRIEKCGCLGMCYAEPLVEVCVSGMPRVIYGKVDKAAAMRIMERHVGSHALVDGHIINRGERDAR